MQWPWWETYSWWFLPKAVLAFYLAVLIHEIGHALVARWCGLRVICVGIGTGSVVFVVPVGSVKVFFGLRDPLGGLTLYASECPTSQKSSWVAWGGPVAELSLAGLSLGLIQLAGNTEFLVWLFYWSSFGTIVSLLPENGARAGKQPTTSDGERIFQRKKLDTTLLRQQREQSLAMLALCKEIGSLLGQIHFSLHVAHESYLLGEIDEAQQQLDAAVLKQPSRGEFHRCFETYLRSMLSGTDYAEQLKRVCQHCPDLQASEAPQLKNPSP